MTRKRLPTHEAKKPSTDLRNQFRSQLHPAFHEGAKPLPFQDRFQVIRKHAGSPPVGPKGEGSDAEFGSKVRGRFEPGFNPDSNSGAPRGGRTSTSKNWVQPGFNFFPRTFVLGAKLLRWLLCNRSPTPLGALRLPYCEGLSYQCTLSESCWKAFRVKTTVLHTVRTSHIWPCNCML